MSGLTVVSVRLRNPKNNSSARFWGMRTSQGNVVVPASVLRAKQTFLNWRIDAPRLDGTNATPEMVDLMYQEGIAKMRTKRLVVYFVDDLKEKLGIEDEDFPGLPDVPRPLKKRDHTPTREEEEDKMNFEEVVERQMKKLQVEERLRHVVQTKMNALVEKLIEENKFD